MRAVITTIALSLAAFPALADEVALLIGNDRYDALDRVRAARGIDDAGAALRREGVEVFALEDADREETFEGIRQFSQQAGDADALAVVLVGRFAEVGEETWFLPTDAEGNSPIDVAEAGIPLSLLTGLLGDMPGRAVLVLGAPDDIGEMDLPQGVTLAVGNPSAALDFAEERLAQPGARLTGDRSMRYDGFVSNTMVFLRQTQAQTPQQPQQPQPQPQPQPAVDQEAEYWRLAAQRNNAAAYTAYLDRYPNGRFVAQARAALARIQETPEQRAARAEEALGLTAAARQDVQRNLSVLGYDTRGIDGIFGSGTRTALRGWQTANNFEATGYLTQPQIEALNAQGSVRAAQLEEEERRRREELRRQDEALWADMGNERSETELANYLERFPDGLHANDARQRLAAIRDQRAADGGASERERQIWRATRQENSADGYRRYLNAFPDGQFVAEARAAIAGLEQTQQQNAPALAEESQLGLTPITRRAVETRLQALGFQPGAVDGTFDAQTRAALRRYQQSAGLPQTGYVNQITAVRLLADTLRDVLR